MDVLQTCSGERRSSPLTCQLQTKWERVSQEEQTFFIRKTTRACKTVCSAIALEHGEALLEAVSKTDGHDVENELRPLLEAYRDAPSKDTKTQILRIYACRQVSCKEAYGNTQTVRANNRMGIA